MIEVSENLKEFAKLTDAAGYKTYLVGGFVRNSLLGLSVDDVDIAGAMPVEDVETICGMAGFKTDVINKKLGTIQIVKDGDRFEYTQFRREEYDETGTHSPNQVEFVTNPKDDAVRRDFTVNAFYYDILEGKLLDFFKGQKDLKRKKLKAVTKPETVFDDDGLRILRLIRFTCELGFNIDSKTYRVAKKCAHKVKDISRERILKEIKIAVNGGLKYRLKNETHGNVIKYFNDLNLWQYIFEGNFKNFKVKQSGKLYKAYLLSDGSNRFTAFMCLVLYNYIKAKSSENNIAFSVNQLLGLSGLKESNKNVQEIYNAYLFVQKLMYLTDVEITSNSNCIAYEKLPFNVKNYLPLVNEDKVNKIKIRIMEMKKSNIPFVEEDLAISNKHIIEEIKIKEQHVSKIRSTLFEMCVEGMIVNDPDILSEQAKFLNEKLLKILADANKRAFEEKRAKDIVRNQEIAIKQEALENAQTKALLESEAPVEQEVSTDSIEDLKVSKKVAMQSPIITESGELEPLKEPAPETEEKKPAKKSASKKTTKTSGAKSKTATTKTTKTSKPKTASVKTTKKAPAKTKTTAKKD